MSTFVKGLWFHQLVKDKAVWLCGKIFHYKSSRIYNRPWPAYRDYVQDTCRLWSSLWPSYSGLQNEFWLILYLLRPPSNLYPSKKWWHVDISLMCFLCACVAGCQCVCCLNVFASVCVHVFTFVYVRECVFNEIIPIVFVFITAIRFGRMPQSEKLKLRAELQIPEKKERKMELDDWKTLASQIHEAYLKQFHLNKAKARGFLTGKTDMPVSITFHSFAHCYISSYIYTSL